MIRPKRFGTENAEQIVLNATMPGTDIFGLGGNDVLQGGNGADWIDGGTGDNALYGGLGNDTLLGGRGHDVLHGGDGDDRITQATATTPSWLAPAMTRWLPGWATT